MSRAQIVGLVGAGALALLALLGGEYGTFDWFSLRGTLAQERAALAGLEGEIDSLAKLVADLENSRAAQERAAREEFGMIRDGEILYRLVPSQER
jgi:cell division protein FtsB